MTKKIFRSTLLIVTFILLISLIVITGVLYNNFEQVQKKQMETELTIAAQGLKTGGEEFLTTLTTADFRITWISATGDVLYDSVIDEKTMENHIDREEVKEALDTGVGESSRYSSTLTEKTMYYAYKLADGSILRISNSLDTVFTLLIAIIYPITVVFICAVIISIIFSRHMARKIVNPLNELDLDNPLENDVYEEIAPLLTKINKQQKKISTHVAKLKQKADEFEQITAHMNEGLVLLNENAVVLSINPAAEKLFETDESCIGNDFLTIDRSPEMNKAIEKALSGKHSSFRSRKNGCEYQFDISRIESGEKILGAVLLAFDISEQAFAERNRQEFTANISHELKTPLQSITGSAELIENGLVKQEDMPRFIGHIRKESVRLVTLINDIIRLSQLDEGVDLPNEVVDLYNLSEEVIGILQPVADRKNVTINLKGEHAVTVGVNRYVYEIIYNLCDNAIKYNKDGGSIDICIGKENGSSILTVSDTGIGIPFEHQNRIFERFYRVDKSHSKETGGTGLGLSIVKHAVSYLDAQITLESTVGEGTTITVLFK